MKNDKIYACFWYEGQRLIWMEPLRCRRADLRELGFNWISCTENPACLPPYEKFVAEAERKFVKTQRIMARQIEGRPAKRGVRMYSIASTYRFEYYEVDEARARHNIKSLRRRFPGELLARMDKAHRGE